MGHDGQPGPAWAGWPAWAARSLEIYSLPTHIKRSPFCSDVLLQRRRIPFRWKQSCFMTWIRPRQAAAAGQLDFLLNLYCSTAQIKIPFGLAAALAGTDCSQLNFFEECAHQVHLNLLFKNL